MAQAIEGRVYAQIRDSKVHWIFTAENLPEWAEGSGEFEIQTVDITDIDPRPQVGWLYSNGFFRDTQPDTPAVPQEVTRFQARAALYQFGLLDDVEAAVADPATDMMLKLAWRDALTFKRYSSFVLGMAATLGLSDAQLDELFVVAAGIE